LHLIVVQQKAPEEILKMTENCRSVLIVGCSGCAGIIGVGGKKEADNLKATLENQSSRADVSRREKIDVAPVVRQCDRQMAQELLHELASEYEALLSLACGVGAQTIADLYPDVLVIPANDTMFLGAHDGDGKFHELCRACGDCILFETGSVCPLTRCPKGLLNGPCGGQVGGKCEVGGWKKDCAWVAIYRRLKSRDRLDLFRRFRPPRDHRVSEPPREIGSLANNAKKETMKELKTAKTGGREAYGKLMKELMAGKFVFTGEFEPEKTTRLQEVVDGARMLRNCVTAINVTDNPTAFGYVNSLVPSYLIQKEADVEAIYQMTTRDRNRLGLLSDVLAAGALGIKNILAITGDYVTVGDTPQAKPVFDLDSAGFVYMLRRIVDDGVDLNGNVIEDPPKFNIGIAASPNADPLEPEVLKIERKVRLGADFIQTQCVYSVEQAERFMDAAAHFKTPVLFGVAPFKSLAMMDWMIKFVPGIKVPEELDRRLRKAREKSKEAFLEENVQVFGDLIGKIRGRTRASGVHVMAVGFEWIVPKVIERSNVA